MQPFFRVISSGVVGLCAVAVILLTLRCGPAQAFIDDPLSKFHDLGFRGEVSYKNFAHFDDFEDEEGHVRNEGILQLEWRRRFNRKVQLSVVTEVRADDGGFARGVHFLIPDDDKHRSVIDLKEVNLKLRVAGFRIGLGKQIVAWGTADTFNPTDGLNSYDYLDPLDSFKMGAWSAQASRSFGDVEVDLVVIPPFTPSRLPFDDGRWGTVVIDSFTPPGTAPGFMPAIGVDTDIPGRSIDNTQVAVRATTTVAGWDFALSYYDGIQNTPDLDNDSIDTVLLTGEIRLFHPRLHIPGLAFSTTWEQFEFHGEGVAIFGESEGREDRFQGIVGLNYTWDAEPLPWVDEVFTILEYAREEEMSSGGGSPFVDFGALSNAFRDAIAGRVRIKLSEETEIALFGTVDLTQSANYFLQPELTHAFTDNLHLEAGFDVIGGDEDTFWGRWKENDRFYTFLKYYF